MSLVLALALAPPHANADDLPRKVTATEALAILKKVVGSGRNYGGLDDATSPRSEPFYLFQGIGLHSATTGWCAVNPWTGDAWSVWWCNAERRLESPSLRKSRAEVKRRFSAAELNQYEALRQLKPGCLLND